MSFLDWIFGEEQSPNQDRLDALDNAIDTIRIMHTNQLVMWAILTRVEWRIGTMATNWNEFDDQLTQLIDGFKAQKAVIETQNAVIADADKKTQEKVDAALTENDAADQERIDAAAALIADGLSRPDPETVDPNNGSTPDVPPSEAPPEIQANPTQSPE